MHDSLFKTNKYDDILCEAYSVKAVDLDKYKHRICRVIDSFSAAFPREHTHPAACFSSPGRAELTGNHTDHQHGQVLTATLTLDTLACAAPNTTDTINVTSEGHATFTLKLSDTAPVESEKYTSKALVRGVLDYFKKKGINLHGFDTFVTSDVPSGLGLSSSASFSVLFAVIINHFFCNGNLSELDLANAAKYAENVHFGKSCGLMDQMAVVLGGIDFIDFKDETPSYKKIDFDFANSGLDIMIVDTGSDHAALTADFEAIPAEMFRIANVFSKAHLREVSEDEFIRAIPELRKATGDRAILRALHWYNECERVKKEAALLSSGDYNSFLSSVSESGRSSFMYLQNVDSYRNPATQPVALTLGLADKLLNGAGAFRVHGGGFAGSIIAFVPKEMTNNFCDTMHDLTGREPLRVNIRHKGAGVLF